VTHGRYALLAILMRTTGREVARRCRVSPSRVSEWASGRTRPSPRARATLAACYRIPSAEWDREQPVGVRRQIAALLSGR
jgi:transcriptional regulator with XRE-family HTH domain